MYNEPVLYTNEHMGSVVHLDGSKVTDDRSIMTVTYVPERILTSEYDMLIQCWFNAGPTSAMSDQH